MKKFLSFTFIFLFLNFENIYAQDFYKLYYFSNTEKFEAYQYKFSDDFSKEEKIIYLLNEILGEQAIKGIFWENKNLYINFKSISDNIPKGSFGELSFIYSILETMFQFEDIETISFLQEGKYFIMPAGSFIYKYTLLDLDNIKENLSEN